MVFQHFNLLESKTVYDNVALPLILNKVDKETIATKVKQMLDFVGLGEKEKSYPSQLSGGQKQRVGIARAFVTNPDILLCDEATSALDPKTTVSILELLKKINQELSITILIVTHEMEVIREICNKVAVMEKGEVIESGDVLHVFGSPRNETTKEFVKTVIPDEIPPSIVQELQADKRNKRIYQMKFFGEKTSKSLLFHLAKEFNVEANIVFANVTELQGTSFGIMTVAYWGEDTELDHVYQSILKQEIPVKEVIL
jgi:D-methionine transport system ATP-binding protein